MTSSTTSNTSQPHNPNGEKLAVPVQPRFTRAVAATAAGGIDAAASFVEVTVPLQPLEPHDLLISVRAVSVNPVDVKVRANFAPQSTPKVLGYDAAGVVVAVGAEVSAFDRGDAVYYAGSIARSGSNAQYQVVDERLVGHKPATLTFAEAAALPLTSITAWETLFTHLRLSEHSAGVLLVMGAAGGVGSMVVQLARKLTNVTVLAAASREESRLWVEQMGAHHVVDRHNLQAAVTALAPDGVDFVFSPFSEGNVHTYADVMAVRGRVVAIDDPHGLDLLPLKSKSQSWHWELMFTTPLYEPASSSQRELLDAVAGLVDRGVLKTTLSRSLTPLDAGTLREAHRLVEGSGMVGKVVVATAAEDVPATSRR